MLYKLFIVARGNQWVTERNYATIIILSSFLKWVSIYSLLWSDSVHLKTGFPIAMFIMEL